MTTHTYLSPHLDDAIYSCGGLITRQVAAGDTVVVITLCAGDPPGLLSPFARELHQRWDLVHDPVARRREEDQAACDALGAEVIHGTMPDAIYRLDVEGSPRYPDEKSIFGDFHQDETRIIAGLAAWVDAHLPPDGILYSPLGLGGHVDHVLTRLCAERLRTPVYFPDYPYAGTGAGLPPVLNWPQGHERIVRLTPLEIQAWVTAAGLYASQRSTFWSSLSVMESDFREYHAASDGLKLIDPTS